MHFLFILIGAAVAVTYVLLTDKTVDNTGSQDQDGIGFSETGEMLEKIPIGVLIFFCVAFVVPYAFLKLRLMLKIACLLATACYIALGKRGGKGIRGYYIRGGLMLGIIVIVTFIVAFLMFPFERFY